LVLLDDDNEDTYVNELSRSDRLKQPRRSTRINKVSWINDDLDDLKFMTYSDDRVYKSEDKIHIVPISNDIEDKHSKNINNATLNKSSKKVHFKSTLSTSKKVKALATMVFGTMASAFNTTINNHTIKPVGITHEIPGQILDAHV